MNASINDLTEQAHSYYLHADFAKAESLYKQALAKNQQDHGEQHIEVATAMHKLGMFYSVLLNMVNQKTI